MGWGLAGGAKKPVGWQRAGENRDGERRTSALRASEIFKNILALIGGYAGVFVDDFSAFDQVGFAAGEHHGGLAEGFEDFFVAVGEEREGEIIFFLELRLALKLLP